jgi:hypothetical protein
VKFVVIWNNFSCFGVFFEEKSGNPEANDPTNGFFFDLRSCLWSVGSSLRNFNSWPNFLSLRTPDHDQGDQIGRIFAYW